VVAVVMLVLWLRFGVECGEKVSCMCGRGGACGELNEAV
jgi:hypothetical protein